MRHFYSAPVQALHVAPVIAPTSTETPAHATSNCTVFTHVAKSNSTEVVENSEGKCSDVSTETESNSFDVGNDANDNSDITGNDRRPIKAGKIKVLCINVYTLTNKMEEFEARVRLEKPGVICVQEILPKHSKDHVNAEIELKLNGYDMFISPSCKERSCNIRVNQNVLVKTNILDDRI